MLNHSFAGVFGLSSSLNSITSFVRFFPFLGPTITLTWSGPLEEALKNSFFAKKLRTVMIFC